MSNHDRETQTYAKWMFIAAWIMVGFLLVVFFGHWEKSQENPNQAPQTLSMNGVRTVILQPNHANHYVVSGEINGQNVVFLLDTGATDVTIPEKVARGLGLQRGSPARAVTANGTITIYRTKIDDLNIGEIHLRNIKASINPHMSGNQILLGMSALRKLNFKQDSGKLILQQH